MQFYSIMGNQQRLDGGAMYGNAPKALWSRWSPPDEQNRIPLACRALLIRTASKLILAETGIGVYMAPDLKDRYGVVEPQHVLLDSLAAVGVSPDQIDAVVLSHLHFDHVGGALAAWAPDAHPSLLFPNATWLVGEGAWQRAVKPHARDRASFIPGFTDLLTETGRLHRITRPDDHPLGPSFRFQFSDGHTPGLTHLEVLGSRRVVFASDLIPGTPWVHLPITMGYDRFPERLIEEKEALLASLVEEGGALFYTHDPQAAASRVQRDNKGRYAAVDAVSTLSGPLPW